jgi:hypothetical protein
MVILHFLPEKILIRIINYDATTGWILTKFAEKMGEYLALFKRPCEVAPQGGANARVAHHVNYYCAPPHTIAPVETLMVTHIDTEEKFKLLAALLAVYQMGICMSEEHRNMLVRTGLPAERLCYVNPAQDGLVRPRPINIGIASNVHSDGRKNEWSIVRALRNIPAGVFCLKIMGSGWEAQVGALRALGHLVDLHDRFDHAVYTREFMPSLDYFVYFSHDEGSMSYLDAVAANVKTIVTPQGFHLDIPGGIDYMINNAQDLGLVLQNIHEEQQKRVSRVAGWTWPEYTWRHLVIWDYLTGRGDREVAAERQVFFKILPKLASNATALKHYLDKAVPEEEILLLAADLASRSGMLHLTGFFLRQALVFYPKNRKTREMMLQLYPQCISFLE